MNGDDDNLMARLERLKRSADRDLDSIVVPVVELASITPNAETQVMRAARQSSDNPHSDNVKLLAYLVKHQHWSPFEMAHMTLQIETSRTIARQLLRHRSFSFQEFSQRYQTPELLSSDRIHWEARTEHPKNRQSSVPTEDEKLQHRFAQLQDLVWDTAMVAYRQCLELNIAREQARALLPEGLVRTRLCMTGSLRSWIHYIQLRTQKDTQQEHRDIAEAAKRILREQCPNTVQALG